MMESTNIHVLTSAKPAKQCTPAQEESMDNPRPILISEYEGIVRVLQLLVNGDAGGCQILSQWKIT